MGVCMEMNRLKLLRNSIMLLNLGVISRTVLDDSSEVILDTIDFGAHKETS